MNYRLWDKKSSINGVSAEEMLKKYPVYGVAAVKVYLLEERGVIQQIAQADTIAGNAIKILKDDVIYNTHDLTDEENMQLLCDVANGIAEYYQELPEPSAEELLHEREVNALEILAMTSLPDVEMEG